MVMNGGEHAVKPREAEFEQRNSFLRGLGEVYFLLKSGVRISY